MHEKDGYLKCCLHAHTLDPYMDLKYKGEQLIQGAKKYGYDVLSLTDHDDLSLPPENFQKLQEIARGEDILLLYGIEANVGERCSHILLINTMNYPREKIKDFNDFRIWVRNDCESNVIVMPSHPFYPGKYCIGDDIGEVMDISDAVEYSFFRPTMFLTQPNAKAIKTAKENDIPVIGNNDVHALWNLGTTYCCIKSEKDPEAIVHAVKTSDFRDCQIYDSAKKLIAENPDHPRIVTYTRKLNVDESFKIFKTVFKSKLSEHTPGLARKAGLRA